MDAPELGKHWLELQCCSRLLYDVSSLVGKSVWRKACRQINQPAQCSSKPLSNSEISQSLSAYLIEFFRFEKELNLVLATRCIQCGIHNNEVSEARQWYSRLSWHLYLVPEFHLLIWYKLYLMFRTSTWKCWPNTCFGKTAAILFDHCIIMSESCDTSSTRLSWLRKEHDHTIAWIPHRC